MSNKSGTTTQVISLPSGGGALQGIGEKFTPDLYHGTGNYTIPIALPPGRNGFQPQLSLNYSTGSGNGAWGIGWGLSIPGITRKTSHGIPQYQDRARDPNQRDTFILSGAEDLIPIDDKPTGTLYCPRTEGLFARIIHHHDAQSNYWEVQSKDGLTSVYGTRGSVDDERAVLEDPQERTRIFAWKLTETRDPFGNRIAYSYQQDRTPTHAQKWSQVYPDQIHYVDYDDANGDEQFLVTVSFSYENRPDEFFDCRAGFEIRTRLRCSAITIHTASLPVRRYEFVYRQAPYNGVSLLHAVLVSGYDDKGNRQHELPPLEFGYTAFYPENRIFSPIAGTDLPPKSLAHPDYELADLFGNALPSLLQMNSSVRIWRNQGAGHFDIPREMRDSPAGLMLADPSVQLADADGDGRIDLMALQNGIGGYFPLRHDGQWDRQSLKRYSRVPSFSLEDPEVKLVDLDGDGITDILRSGASLECYFNDKDPKMAWQRILHLERQTLAVFPNVNFSDPRVKFGDMNGDILQDIVLVSDNNVEYWPYYGHGRWGAQVSMRNSPHLPYGYDPRRILLGDVDGDGADDLVYVDNQCVYVWINQSGLGWSDTPIEIKGTPAVSDIDSVRLVDLLGTGTPGLLWSIDAGGQTRETMYYLSFTDGEKPYLLNKMDNHLGSTTKVIYASSTDFYLADQQKPETRWKTSLPFPVQVVALVEVFDALSHNKLTTEYCYHNGYWDGAEREFRGFANVEKLDGLKIGVHNSGKEPFRQTQDRTHFSPPVCTRTWFHQGPVGGENDWTELDLTGEYWFGDPSLFARSRAMRIALNQLPRRASRDAIRTLQGSILRTEVYALDGSDLEERPYTVTEYLYEVREEQLPETELTRSRIFFPHLRAERITQWERGDDPMMQITFTDDYDKYGQPLQQTVVALPRRSTKCQRFKGALSQLIQPNETRILSTHTRWCHATPTGIDPPYIHNRVSQVRTFTLAIEPRVNESDPDDLLQVMRDYRNDAEGVRDQFQMLLKDWRPGQAPPIDLKLIGHTINHYDGSEFLGAHTDVNHPEGVIQQFGALVRSEALVFTDHELETVYGDLSEVVARLKGTLGYRHEIASVSGYHEGYYADTLRRQFDFQVSNVLSRRGLVTATQDALGNTTTIAFDDYGLLPIRVIDAANMQTNAIYNYRVMQPEQIIDVNGNASHFRYTPTGLLHKQFLVSRTGLGGKESEPEAEFRYDFFAYERTRTSPQPQPIFAHLRQRIWHADDHISDDVIESREYSDGFGRVIQKVAQAEALAFGANGDDSGLALQPGAISGSATGHRDATRVVVSGWQIYDNKGLVVEKYEPFFRSGWDYQPEAASGEHIEMYYDPRGQLIRTVNPDGSQQRIIYGIPPDLSLPDEFSPTPWEAYIYDPNDLAEQSHDVSGVALAAYVPQEHYYTPTTTILNAQGKVICQVERNGDTNKDWYVTSSAYDVRGNLLSVWDARGREAFKHVYDLTNRPLRVDSIDAGIRISLLDAANNLVEYRDSKGSLVIREFDKLNRLVRLSARDKENTEITLREVLIYGDSPADSIDTRNVLPDANLVNGNLKGRLYRHYDEAGVVQASAYDFKGNLIDKTRYVISDTALTVGWSADWQKPNALDEVDRTSYQTRSKYDALNRAVEITSPTDVNGQSSVFTPTYDRAGRLERVELDGQPYVSQIAYNAKGQRVFIAYGNEVMTRYRYNERTFRLVSLHSEKFGVSVAADTWRGVGAPIQDFTYQYDLVGNITSIEERILGCGIAIANRDQLRRKFTYDPLYRLRSADGRTCQNQARTFDDILPCGLFQNGVPNLNQQNAPDWTERYTEYYEYDPTGNLLRLDFDGVTTDWTRLFSYDHTQNNQLVRLEQSGVPTAYQYKYDKNGNLTEQGLSRRHTWDHADRMTGYTQQAGATPSLEARYLYGADGTRVKKWTRRNGSANTIESTVYIDGFFEHDRWKENGAARQNNHLHVMDNQTRIALVRRGATHSDDLGPAVQYQLSDHLSSSYVVINDDGGWINREEHSPYGETSFGSYARKRYRFTGKERDTESGLNYHDARYYAPWIMRWVSCDPEAMVDNINLYIYVKNNPISFIDAEGGYARGAYLIIGGRMMAIGGSGVALGGAVIGAGASILAAGYVWYQVYKLRNEVESAKHNSQDMQRHIEEHRKRVDQEVEEAHQNGELTQEEYERYKEGGPLPPGFYSADGSKNKGYKTSDKNQEKIPKKNATGSNYSDSYLRQKFMRDHLKKIQALPDNNPLKKALVDSNTKDWAAKTTGKNKPGHETAVAVQAGHAAARVTGEPQFFGLESADANEGSGATIESKGAYSFKVMIEIFPGIWMELGTAKQLERMGSLPPGSVDKAKPGEGWQAPPRKSKD